MTLLEKIKSPGQKKILALDGGGIRGVLTLEILVEMEKQLRQGLKKDDDFVLGDYFDYIGGTSTGAIIAAGLSLGFSTKKLLDFYDDFGEKMFDKAFLLNRYKYLYNSGPLLTQLKETFGNETDIGINSGKFKTLLCVVAMNRTTDSPWPVSNNPFAKYNDLSRPDCNLKIKLYQLVRASTAAPVFFGPETLQWDPNDSSKSFVFVDGGVTPYNNPSFLLYRMSTLPEYKLGWEKGEDKLLIVSVGTGAAPSEGEYSNVLKVATNLPNNLLYAMQVDQDINCRTVGRCSYGADIDRELKNMVSDKPLTENTGKDFLYMRYNADLTRKGLDEMGLQHLDAEHVRKMDSVKFIDQLHEVGKAASKQVSFDHFGSFV